MDNICRVTDCEVKVRAKGLCQFHYRYGEDAVRTRLRGWDDGARLLANRRITNDGCWEYTGAADNKGYGRLWSSSEKRLVRAHRMAWSLWRGEVPVGLQLDHLCRNRLCFNPDHLEPVTAQTNVRRGSVAKVTPEMAAAIVADNRTQTVIAAHYGISQPTVSEIKRGVRSYLTAGLPQ